MIRASQEHGATAHPVRTGQPGDRQENAARAGPRLISTASSVVNPKTTTEPFRDQPISTKCAPSPGPPRSQIMPRPPNRRLRRHSSVLPLGPRISTLLNIKPYCLGWTDDIPEITESFFLAAIINVKFKRVRGCMLLQ